MVHENAPQDEETLYHRLHDWLLRFLAVFVMAISFIYWLRLVGWYEAPNWRFDLMNTQWKIIALTGAIIGPIAAMGLWLVTPWGGALWSCLAIVHIVFFGLIDTWFERNMLFVISISILTLGYLYLWVRIQILARQ